MKSMTELIIFFQIEYPMLVAEMRVATHHLTNADTQNVEINIVGNHNSHPINLNPYHLEGNIWEHTLLVCKQAENTSYEVQIAALLHDIGKPSTRKVNPKNGNVSFYNHDAVSAFMSLEILKRPELNLNKEQQIRIFNMIALHTQIYKLSIDQLSKIGNSELLGGLIELGTADHAGRFHSKGDAVIPKLGDILFELAEPRETTKEVVILCGLPNGGKSTSIKNLDLFKVSRDGCLSAEAMMRDVKPYSKSNQKHIDKLLQERFKESKNHANVVVDMTHMSKKSRRRTLSHYGSEYKKKCVMFLPDLNTIFDRNTKRKGKVMSEDVIQKMIRSYYPPTHEEFDEIEYVL